MKLEDTFIEKNNVYLVMEYMNCDLGKLIDDPKLIFSEGEVADIFRQIVEGVSYLHHRSILHRVSEYQS